MKISCRLIWIVSNIPQAEFLSHPGWNRSSADAHQFSWIIMLDKSRNLGACHGFNPISFSHQGCPVAQMVKNPLQCGRPGFDPWVGKIPWRKAWQPTPVFLPGESPWTKEPGGLQSLGLWRVRQDWATKHTAHLVTWWLNDLRQVTFSSLWSLCFLVNKTNEIADLLELTK